MNSPGMMRPNLNLQQMSAISLSSRLWDIKRVKQRIKSFFAESNYRHVKHWNKIENLVIYYLYKLIRLPKSLFRMVEEIIYMMGGKIWRWTEHVQSELGVALKFAEKIIWTCFGTVDEGKIFKDIWRRNFDDFLEKGVPQVHPLFIIGCTLVQEDFLMDFNEEIVEALSKDFHLQNIDFKKNELYDLTALTLTLHVNKKQKSNEDFVSNTKSSIRSPIKMFRICLSAGYFKAAKFFWEKLNESEKRNELLHVIETCIYICFDDVYLKVFDLKHLSYKKEKQIEILAFLINEAFRYQDTNAISFLGDLFSELFQIFISSWPYQETCVNLFYKFSDILAPESHRYVFLLLAKSIKKIRKRELQAMESIFEKLFIEMFLQLPDFIKQDVFTSENHLLKEYFGILNRFFISNLLDDKDLKHLKPLILREGLEFLKTTNMGFLEEFLQLVLQTFMQLDSELEESFACLCQNFIVYEQLYAADLILDALSKTVKERIQFKNRINPKSVCEKFILKKWRYDLAENFLDWRFDTTEEKKAFKSSLPSDWYIYDRCVNTHFWAQDYEVTITFDFSLEGINGFISSIAKSRYKYLMAALINSNRLNKLKLLGNIMEPLSDTMLSENLIWWNNIYGEEFRNFENFDFIFEWSCVHEGKRERVARDFVNRDFGHVLIRILIFLILGSRCA